MDRITNLSHVLVETSTNRTPNTELSPNIRGVIVGMQIAGKSTREIARTLQLP